MIRLITILREYDQSNSNITEERSTKLFPNRVTIKRLKPLRHYSYKHNERFASVLTTLSPRFLTLQDIYTG
jgi:hypothetical protein